MVKKMSDIEIVEEIKENPVEENVNELIEDQDFLVDLDKRK